MHKFNLIFDRLLLLLACLAAAIFAAIALAIPLNVVLRNWFGTSIRGLLDVIEFGILAATFLAAPWVLSKNGHVSVDLVVSALPHRGRRLVDLLANLIGLAVSSVFFWYAVQAMLTSYQRGAMVRATFIYPEWWVLAIIPASMALIVVEFLRRLVHPTEAARSLSGL